jgi:vitamin B12 transporter
VDSATVQFDSRLDRFLQSAHSPFPIWFALVLLVATAAMGEGDTHEISAHRPTVSDEFDNVEEMVVSAAHAPMLRGSVPRFTTVIEGKDLETTVSTSVADALRFVPGLQLTQAGARGGLADLSLRGLDPNHVVVLVDGVRMNDPTNSRGGSFDPTTLALVSIERIEVVPGSLSSVYGSDALAGVINIITRDTSPNAEPTASVRARGGRFHTANVAAQFDSGLAGVAGISIGAGFDTSRDPNSGGGYDGVSVKAKLNARLPLAIELEAFSRLHWSSARSFPDSSGGPELAGLRQLEDRDVREILFGLSLERELGREAHSS